MFFGPVVFYTVVFLFVITDLAKVDEKTTVTVMKSKEASEERDGVLQDSYTFVAIIDVVFPNSMKRSCTGTIIHENVVLTAAQCFVCEYDENMTPELTMSFVVIGSKRMFESGYEQYLPIERIKTHPKFEGWKAALSLVFTFATMTSDKPGKILKLAGDKTSNPVDSNVTVYSWIKVRDDEILSNAGIDSAKYSKTDCPESSSNEQFMRADTTPTHNPSRFLVQMGIPYQSAPSEPRNVDLQLQKINLYRHGASQFQQTEKSWSYRGFPVKLKYVSPSSFKRSSLTSDEKSEYENDSKTSDIKRPVHETDSTSTSRPGRYEPGDADKSSKRSWRRMMDLHQNRLVIKVFGFMNIGNCKKIIEGSATPQYGFKHGEVACYASEERHITDEDLGAPAVRHGQLVAVTVGGAESDGDHVGVGLKMSCYCSWIAANLPPDANLVCCKNCCEVNHGDETRKSRARRYQTEEEDSMKYFT